VPSSELYKLICLSNCNFINSDLLVKTFCEDFQSALVVERQDPFQHSNNSIVGILV